VRRLAVWLIAAGLSSGFGSPGSTADLPADVLYGPQYGPALVVPRPLAYNWTGLYVGGHVGYAGGDSKLIFQPTSQGLRH
jgi:hypothetical protein